MCSSFCIIYHAFGRTIFCVTKPFDRFQTVETDQRSTITDRKSLLFTFVASWERRSIIDQITDQITDHRSSIVQFLMLLDDRTITDHRSPINNHRSPVYVLSTETIVRSPIVDQKTPIADRSNRQSTYLVRRLSCDLDYRSPIKKTD